MKRTFIYAGILSLTMMAGKGTLGNDKSYFSVTADSGRGMIRLVGRISEWYNSADDIEEKVRDLVNQGVKDATLYLRSWGGDVLQANEIANVLKKSGLNIDVEIGAWAGSAATIVSSHFTKVKMAKNGWFMVHKPSMEAEGNEDEMERNLNLLKDMTKQIADLYAKKTGKSADYIKGKWMSDWWMNAEQAKAEGFVDELIDDEALTADDIAEMKANGLVKPITATAKPKESDNKPKTNNKVDEKELMAMALSLGLKADATAAEVTARMNELKEKAAKHDSLLAEQKAKDETDKATQIKNILDEGVKAGKITATQHQSLTDMGKTSTVDAIKSFVDACTPVKPISGSLKTTPTGEGAASDADQYKTFLDFQKASKEDQGKFAAEHPDKLKALFKANYGKEMSDQLLEGIKALS